MTSAQKREFRLRHNMKNWTEADGTWILGRHGFEEEPGTGSSHRVFVSDRTGVKVTLYVHGATLLRDVAQAILDQIDQSDDVDQEVERDGR